MFNFLKKRMQQPRLPAETELLSTLQAGHQLTVRWDCGGDESFVYTQLDGEELEANYSRSNDLPSLLDQYLTERLELPGAGEFSMEGTGRIFQEGQEVVIEYQSQAFADTSWMDDMSDEELTAIGYTRPVPAAEHADDNEEEYPSYPPDPEMSDAYSGRLVLFTLP